MNQSTVTKLYIPTTLNIDLILWPTQLFVCSRVGSLLHASVIRYPRWPLQRCNNLWIRGLLQKFCSLCKHNQYLYPAMFSNLLFLINDQKHCRNSTSKSTLFKEACNKTVTYQLALAKGQSISKCPFGVIVWTKIPTKIFPRFLP